MRLAPCAFLLLLPLGLACAPDTAALNPGYAALARRDYPGALSAADRFLAANPPKSAIPDALYLRGRALEDRPAANPAASAADRAAARANYVAALQRNPRAQLRGYLLASVGSVAFFQEDYTTAASSCAAAEPLLDRADLRAAAALRTAQSLQRSGRFAEADAAYDRILRTYPGGTEARRAADSRGARAFYLALASLSSPNNARQMIARLSAEGFTGLSTAPNGRGQTVVRLGPYPTYPAARAAQASLANRFSDAVILP